MPYASPDELIHDFVKLWSNKGLIIGFDWPHWDEGRRWYADDDPSKYDGLDKTVALKLLTAVIRSDRFNEGALMQAFESGQVPKIVDAFVRRRG